MDRVPGGGGVRRRPPTGGPGSGVLGQLRERLRVEVRPPATKEPSGNFIKVLVAHDAPSETLEILVPQAVPKDKDKPSDELVGPEGVLEVLVVGIGPSFTRDDSSMAGQFTPAHNGMDGAVAPRSVPPMAEQFNRRYMRNAPKDKDHRSGESGRPDSKPGRSLPAISGHVSPGHMREAAVAGFMPPPKAVLFGNHEESKGFWSFEGWKLRLNGWKTKCYTQFNWLKRKYHLGREIYDAFGKGPGLFEDIGCEARGLLTDDFVARTLTLSAGLKDDDISLAVGKTLLDEDSVTKFLFNGKYLNSSLWLDATSELNEDEISRMVVSQIVFHKILGPGTNAHLYIPYPYADDDEKLEVRSLHRYAGLAGHLKPHAPHVEGSFLLGNRFLAFGGMLQINAENLGIDYAIGATARTRSISVGVVKGKVADVTSIEGTLFKTLENKMTSFGLIAKHSSGNLPWYERTSLTMGASHSYPSQDLVLKWRLSSSGIGGILAKKRFFGKFSLALSSEFDFNRVQEGLQFQQNLREGLKCGVVFSIP